MNQGGQSGERRPKIGISRVLRILVHRGGFLERSLNSQETANLDINHFLFFFYLHISHHTISYQGGGGDYRGIYDIGFKRGFYGVYRPFIECPLQDR
jgi:hypothetical protein